MQTLSIYACIWKDLTSYSKWVTDLEYSHSLCLAIFIFPIKMNSFYDNNLFLIIFELNDL